MIAAACVVLIVDPCSETQARIAEHLQGRGFSIITATEPVAAMAMIDMAAPHVVITDLFLPEGGGLALTKRLKTRHGSCPVIAMTGDGSSTAIIQALRAGAVDYLNKPIAVEELAHALQRARQVLPLEIHSTAVRRFEHIVTMHSHPDHIPHTVSWLLKSTGVSLPENHRLHVQGALQELLLNAVEHGNLEICYHDKRRAIAEDRFEQLVAERLAQRALSTRLVTIHVLYEPGRKILQFRITDEGRGFKWRTYLREGLYACPSDDVNGRGIFLVHSFFPEMTYNEAGNEVTITVPLN
ncbi:MAG: response regulator [Nitrospiraceae bacterium]|nr:response regulator [Nitrospiraceae bacterium]